MESPAPSHTPEPVPQKPAPSPKNAGPTLQVLANILTIIVALAAIGLSIWEGRESRRYNRLSVLPHLEASEEMIQQASQRRYAITYGIENTGLGPAVIKNLTVFRDGQQIYDALAEGGQFSFNGFLDEVNALPFPTGSFVHTRGAGELLATNTIHVLFRLYVPEGDSLPGWPPGTVRDEVINRYSFLFCYCSVYDENCGEVVVGVKPPAGAQCTFR